MVRCFFDLDPMMCDLQHMAQITLNELIDAHDDIDLERTKFATFKLVDMVRDLNKAYRAGWGED